MFFPPMILVKVGDGPWRLENVPLVDYQGAYTSTVTVFLAPELSRFYDWRLKHAQQEENNRETGIDRYFRELEQNK